MFDYRRFNFLVKKQNEIKAFSDIKKLKKNQ